MHTIKFMSAKDGQGVTVTAAAFAARQAQLGRKVHLLITGDTLAALGAPASLAYGEVVQVAENFTAGWRIGDNVECDVLVMDGDHHGPADEIVLVTRACYLALRRAMNDLRLAEATKVVLIEEEGRSLTERDVASCTGLPVLTTPSTPTVARAVDAGLLATRVPPSLARLAERILARPQEVDA